MNLRTRAGRILDSPFCYTLWMKLFFAQKFVHIQKSLHEKSGASLLDLGCGTGLMSSYLKGDFAYYGVDKNNGYVQYAQRTHRGTFICADITSLSTVLEAAKFHHILVNSVLHHMDDVSVIKVLSEIRPYLLPQGTVIIIEPLLTATQPGLRSVLAHWDRGSYFRSKDEYIKLFQKQYQVAEYEEFMITFCSLRCWQLAKFILTPPSAHV